MLFRSVLSASVRQPPFYVVSPKLDGASLAQILTEQGQLDVPLALWIARQTADGLAALFESTGLIHADVKPANILVSPLGHATLLDFGFAQSPHESRHWAGRDALLHRAGDGDLGDGGRPAGRRV